MKQLLILFFCSIVVQAQTTISGKIFDVTTKEPISFVNVYVPQTYQGVYTNEDGVFKLQIASEVKTITISYLGYKTLDLEVNKFTKNEVLSIPLKEEEYQLSEIIVTNKPLHTIVGDLVSNSQAQLERSIKLETYYREFVKINNQYSKFADGLVDYYLKPKRKDEVKAKVVVNQSRAYELTKKDDVEAKGSVTSNLNSLYNFKDATNDFFSFNVIESYLSNAKTSANYDFNITRKVTENGTELEIIDIKAKPEIQKVLVEGYIIYYPEKKLILEYNLKMSDVHKKYSELKNALLFKAKVNDFGIKVSFKENGSQYIPNYKKINFDVYVKFGKMINDNLSGTADVLVNSYQDENVVFPQKDKIYKESSLYESGTNFRTEYWKTNQAMPLSEKEEAILKQIQN